MKMNGNVFFVSWRPFEISLVHVKDSALFKEWGKGKNRSTIPRIVLLHGNGGLLLAFLGAQSGIGEPCGTPAVFLMAWKQ